MKLRAVRFALPAIAIAIAITVAAVPAGAAELPAPPATPAASADAEPLFVDGTACAPNSTSVETAAPAALDFEILFVDDLSLIPEPQAMGGCFCSGCTRPTGICQCWGDASCCSNCCAGAC